MSSSSAAWRRTLASPTEQQANALEATAMNAKLMVATGSGDVQQLKDLVSNQEQDSKMMVVVMAKQQQAAASSGNPHQGNMDPRLLALASSGSAEELKSLLSGEDYGPASGHGSLLPLDSSGSSQELKSLLSREDGQDSGQTLPSSYGDDDIEANGSILEGVTAQGDTALHVVAASGCCNGDHFLQSACIIHGKARDLLFVENNNGDTPLHCAARVGKSNMVKRLVDLAFTAGENSMKELLRKENKHKETALNEAVRVGNKDIVDLLMDKDSELASFPRDGGASPMYLAILLKRDEIMKTLYEKSHGNLSLSGPNGQNGLHAAVLRCTNEWYEDRDYLTKLLQWIGTHHNRQNKDRIIAQRDNNGTTPLHIAAAKESLFGPSTVCRQVLEANPYALYQPDHAGFFPIHVAASEGAFWNVRMFVRKHPGSAGLRDAKGRTFLHVAVDKRMVQIIQDACRNLSLSWIVNMVDNDGNTALHLAVESSSVLMFGALLRNPQVNLNLPNNNGETPFDIARHVLPKHGLYTNNSSEANIPRVLGMLGAVKGICHQDHLLEHSRTLRGKQDKSKLEMEMVKESTGALCIGSVLIATVTFGATFAVPGGYIADDHTNGGSPILAQRYAFNAFIASNTLAFVLSAMATIGLMYCGSPVFNNRSRSTSFAIALYLLMVSITSLAAAFALAAYVVLAPVAHKTAVATCVLSSLVPLIVMLEQCGRILVLLPPIYARKGLIWTISVTVGLIGAMLLQHWPIIFIFGWAVYANPAPTLQAAPAPLA